MVRVFYTSILLEPPTIASSVRQQSIRVLEPLVNTLQQEKLNKRAYLDKRGTEALCYFLIVQPYALG